VPQAMRRQPWIKPGRIARLIEVAALVGQADHRSACRREHEIVPGSDDGLHPASVDG
jgi:hypothetical protein